MIRKFKKIEEIEGRVCGLTQKFARMQHGIYEESIETNKENREDEKEENER